MRKNPTIYRFGGIIRATVGYKIGNADKVDPKATAGGLDFVFDQPPIMTFGVRIIPQLKDCVY